MGHVALPVNANIPTYTQSITIKSDGILKVSAKARSLPPYHQRKDGDGHLMVNAKAQCVLLKLFENVLDFNLDF